MKVLWITPVILPAASRHLGISDAGSGGWLGAMAPRLRHATPSIDLNVLILHGGSRTVSFREDGVGYHILPDEGSVFRDNSSISRSLRQAIEKVKPDLIDIQGVEFHYAKYVPEAAPGIPVAATIQGLTSEIHKHYCGNIPLSNLLRFRTIKDNLFLDGMLERKIKYQKRGVSELDALRRINYMIGRTSWDHSVTTAANPNSRYYYSQRNIRQEFYERQWCRSEADSFTIFISQSHAPFKGFHIVLEAAAILKKHVPDLRIQVAGRDMLDKSTVKQRLRFGGYQKYIHWLIEENNLTDIVSFTGLLSASQMAERMSRSHVFVLPSFVENSPNSLGEAQLMGVPSIAAYVGGVPDMVSHNETGFLYNATDSAVLAELLHRIFLDDDLAMRISLASRAAALKRYNTEKSGHDLALIYQEIHRHYHGLAFQTN